MADIAHHSKAVPPAAVTPKPEVSAERQGDFPEKVLKPKFPLPVELFGAIRPRLNLRWLVKGLLMSGSSTVIFGPPGAGKSFFVIDIALHVATGRTWFGREVTPGGVVYIAAEGQAGLRNRITAWKKLHGIGSDVPFALIPMAVDLFDPKADIERLIQTLKMLKEKWGSIVFIVIDTLAATIGGGDENGHDMTAYVSNILRLCQPYKCSVAIVTHVPHDAGSRPRPRGHSSLLGAMDTAIHINTVGGNGTRLAKVTKQKDDDPGEGISFQLEPVEIGSDDDGEIVTSCCLAPIESEIPNRRGGKRLNVNQTLGFTTLQSVIASAGIEPAGTIPESKLERVSRICSESAWRDAFVREITKPDTKADTLGRTFRRVRTILKEEGFIGVHGDWVWIVE